MIKYRNGNFLLTIDHYSVEILAHEAVIYDLETIFRRLFTFKAGDTVHDFEFFWETTTDTISVTMDNLNNEEFFIFLDGVKCIFNFYDLAKECVYDIMRDIGKLVHNEKEMYNLLYDIEYNAIEFDREFHEDLISFVNHLKFDIKEYELRNQL